jgi:2-alkyl-3-oxoalkanoate reductase
MKIFLAGAEGVVGRRLLPLLQDGGHDVIALSRSDDGAHRLVRRDVQALVGDVLDHGRMLALFSEVRPDVAMFQISGVPRDLGPGHTQDQFAGSVLVRTVGARNFVEAARAAGTRRVVAQSYAHVYEPRGGWVKQESDPLNLGEGVPEGRLRNVEAIVSLERCVCDAPGVEGVALRYGTLYGPGTAYGWDGSVAEYVRARRYPIAGGGTGWTSFVHVDDAARAAVLALDGPTGRYNITDDEPAPLHVWLPRYAESLCAPSPRRVPGVVARALLGEHFAYRSISQRAADNRWARAQIGFVPGFRTWRDGFRAEFDLDLELAA